MIFAWMSAIFAALTSILAKIGVQNVNSNLGTAIRTAVVLVMAWIVVAAKGKKNVFSGLGGKAFVVFTGDVSACEAAVRAAEATEGVQGLLSQSVVIPAPNMDLVRRSIY